ncbi:MAG TPA: ankyrin repeat domain-containing protein [Thermoplasmata archaeon]|nr:ankyrin repeat domain-containing protein [Thermoplasmata archaeon]
MGDQDDIVLAVRKNDAAKVKELLAANPNLILTKTPEGSLLLTAVFSGAREVMRALLPRFPQLNVHEASSVGDAQRLQRILEEEPALVNAPHAQGFSPLGLAAFFGHKAAVQVLVARGAEVDALDKSQFANTALDAAVAANHLEVVKILLQNHASANVRAVAGHTPLHKAAMNGNLEIAKLLIEAKADVNATDDAQKTPLAYAEEKGHAEVASLLRTRGATG